MRLIQTMLAIAFALLIGSANAMAESYPKFTGLVVDAANVLPPATEADLTRKLEALQKDTRRQLVVATIPDLGGLETPEYGVGLFRAWRVGLKGADNGAILFIAPNERPGHRGPRVQVGYGLEPILTDAFSGQMIRTQMMPKLTESNDVAGAMTAGTDALIRQLRASPEEAKAEVDAAAAAFDKSHRRSANRGGGFPTGLIVWAFILGFVVLSFARRGAGGRRYRGDAGGGDGLMPVILWGLANEIGRHAAGGRGWGSGGGDWGGGDSGGGSDGSWGGGGFTGGGGGDTGGGGASGSW